MATFLPTSENQIKCVSTYTDFINTPFKDINNAICWERKLEGNFLEIVEKIELKENITVVDPIKLSKLTLSKEGEIARDLILSDLKALKNHGASPTLNLIKNYMRDDVYPYFPTDVYSFHVDRSPVPTDTYLCTYYGASSDILLNTQAEQKIHIPEIRNELKTLYDGPEAGFNSFLSEHFFDLHYQAKLNSKPINLGLGHLWKLAVDYPGNKVLPCVHRAPKEKDGEYRLLLIC